MNFANIKTLAMSLYQLKTNTGRNDFGVDNIAEAHFNFALAEMMKPYLGGFWYRNYRNRPELQAVSITKIEEYSTDDDYCKVTCDGSHYLTDGQNIVFTDSTLYDEIYKIELIADSDSKTGYELDTFLFYDDFAGDEQPTFEDQIKKDLDFCTAVLMIEKAAGFNRNIYQFDFNYQEYGKGDKRFSNWEQVAKRHADFIKSVGNILNTFDSDEKDKTKLGFMECL